ncbi:unnamed protein product [Musa banksii]
MKSTNWITSSTKFVSQSQRYKATHAFRRKMRETNTNVATSVFSGIRTQITLMNGFRRSLSSSLRMLSRQDAVQRTVIAHRKKEEEEEEEEEITVHLITFNYPRGTYCKHCSRGSACYPTALASICCRAAHLPRCMPACPGRGRRKRYARHPPGNDGESPNS